MLYSEATLDYKKTIARIPTTSVSRSDSLAYSLIAKEYALQTVRSRGNTATLRGSRPNDAYEQKAVIQRPPLIDSKRPISDVGARFPNDCLLTYSCQSIATVEVR